MERRPDVLTPQQAAEALGVGRQTVYRYIRQGKLLASKLRGRYRLSRRHVEFLRWERSSDPTLGSRIYSKEEIATFLQAGPLDEEAQRIADHLARAPESIPCSL